MKTDIVCETDREAVNIVVNTEMGWEDIENLISHYQKQRESAKKMYKESIC